MLCVARYYQLYKSILVQLLSRLVGAGMVETFEAKVDNKVMLE